MPVYNDNRLLLSQPKNRQLVYRGLASLAGTMKVDAVAGCATGGIAPAVGLADLLELDFLYVRSKPKAHGTGKAIEGANPQGLNVLVVEDLISTGGSSLAAIEALETAGAKILDCLSIFSYDLRQAENNFKKAKKSYRSLLSFETCLLYTSPSPRDQRGSRMPSSA